MLPRGSQLTESELFNRCYHIAGLSFHQLALQVGWSIPNQPLQRKGWIGQTIERALGTTAGNHSGPDFHELGIELKTIPLGAQGKPLESTFVTSIPLLSVHKQTWETSQCFAKLKRILWVPVEGLRELPFEERRIGLGFLWSPTEEQSQTLARDWSELTFMIGTGKLAVIDATHGTYLQVRPKAAHSKSLCYGLDEAGNRIQTLPRGFYLRSTFTAGILETHTKQIGNF